MGLFFLSQSDYKLHNKENTSLFFQKAISKKQIPELKQILFSKLFGLKIFNGMSLLRQWIKTVTYASIMIYVHLTIHIIIWLFPWIKALQFKAPSAGSII